MFVDCNTCYKHNITIYLPKFKSNKNPKSKFAYSSVQPSTCTYSIIQNFCAEKILPHKHTFPENLLHFVNFVYVSYYTLSGFFFCLFLSSRWTPKRWPLTSKFNFPGKSLQYVSHQPLSVSLYRYFTMVKLHTTVLEIPVNKLPLCLKIFHGNNITLHLDLWYALLESPHTSQLLS